MPDGARLIDVRVPRDPAGIVLVLHGGGSRGKPMTVSPTQLSVLRMIPIARRVARAGAGRLAVLRLLNTHRGWDTHHTPVDDVRWALGQVAERFGTELPVCLVGHSLGGRAALLSAGEHQVRGVVALAPWVYPDDAPDPGGELSGTPVLIIHGDGDRVALPERSAAVAASLRRRTQVAYVTVSGGTHAMLRQRDAFDGLAAAWAAWVLIGETDDPRVRELSGSAG